jgi:hypothetical protein
MGQLLARIQPIALLPFRYPEEAKTLAFQPAPNLTNIARGTVLGQITSVGATQYMVKPYANANADGSQTAIGISMYDFSTDANSNVVLGNGTAWGIVLGHELTIPVYINGWFKEADLTGLDAAAIVDFFAREFNLADGTKSLRIP